MHVSAGSYRGRSVTIYGHGLFKADGVQSETTRAVFVGQDARRIVEIRLRFPSSYSAFVRLSSPLVPLPPSLPTTTVIYYYLDGHGAKMRSWKV